MTETTVTETPEIRLKRLRIRSWRRGTKEMDLLLGRFADGPLSGLDPATLDAYEALLDENDTDLYVWVSGQAPYDGPHRPMIDRLRAYHAID